jgi:hypothetical protein
VIDFGNWILNPPPSHFRRRFLFADGGQMISTKHFSLFLLLLLAGCGGGVAAMTGEVNFPDGKPVAGTVVIELTHDDVRERKSYQADIAADGTFHLQAPPGSYRVMIAPPQQKLGGVEGSARKLTFDEKFASFETSKLMFEVTSDPAKNHFKIPVTYP